MKKWLHRIEIFADRAIPYALIVLLITIIGEISFTEYLDPYSFYVSLIDWTVISIFAVDLAFKYVRSKNVPQFLRRYWLEIISVFPAFLVVKVVEEFILITHLDESVLLAQEAAEFEARVGTRASRLHYFSRFLRPLARIPRFFRAFKFYERPHHKFF
jgi:hypothetical protein